MTTNSTFKAELAGSLNQCEAIQGTTALGPTTWVTVTATRPNRDSAILFALHNRHIWDTPEEDEAWDFLQDQ